METNSGTDIGSGQVDLLKEDIEVEEEVGPDFTPERLPDESFDDYKDRRKAVKKWTHRVRFTSDDEGLNRIARRKKTKLHLTKKIRKVRGKYIYGMIKDDDDNLITNNITEAYDKDINPIQFARMRKMGLTLKQYLSIAENTEKNLNEMLKDNEKFKEFTKTDEKEGKTDDKHK